MRIRLTTRGRRAYALDLTLCAALTLSPTALVAAGEGALPREQLVAVYVHLADQFRVSTGDPSEAENREVAVLTLARWSTRAAETAARGLIDATKRSVSASSAARFTEAETLLAAALLLETEAASLIYTRGREDVAAEHEAIAQRLLEALPPSPARLAFERQWLLLIGRLHLARARPAHAVAAFERGLAHDPNDLVMLMGDAAALESVSTLCVDQAERDPTWSTLCLLTAAASTSGAGKGALPLLASEQGMLALRREILEREEKRLRELLRLDPAQAEARLRLARVLARRGREAEAQAELATVLASHGHDRFGALAHLFSIELAERRGDEAAALDQARRAVAVVPRGQTAQIALASTLLAQGEREAARRALTLDQEQTAGAVDLWIEFLFDPSNALLATRQALLEQVRRP